MRTNGKGFDSDIYFVQVTGESLPPVWREPLVLRVKPNPDAIVVARYEATIQDWAADCGYPTPRILQVFETGELSDRPVQAMERAAGDIVIRSHRSSSVASETTDAADGPIAGAPALPLVVQARTADVHRRGVFDHALLGGVPVEARDGRQASSDRGRLAADVLELSGVELDVSAGQVEQTK